MRETVCWYTDEKDPVEREKLMMQKREQLLDNVPE